MRWRGLRQNLGIGSDIVQAIARLPAERSGLKSAVALGGGKVAERFGRGA